MILTEQLTEKLTELHQQLTEQGDLPPRPRLEEYYTNFRRRFGPDQLQRLDGEALLETMHNHSNPDSLVYWLEFKNDEEFPAIFGSIAGGSALKFGIYRRKETGLWMTGSPTKQRELTTTEAVEIARRHRDQFIQGVELLVHLPPHGSDNDYRRLQAQMDALAPDVSQKSWGHKYFSLLYPDKLDDYHNPDYQRFHLITLLQTPPSGEGRYLVAGRYVTIANELGIPMNHLTTVLNHRHSQPYRYWRIGTKLGETDSRWEMMRDTNCVAIGWAGLGDLSQITYDRESKERIRDALTTHYPKDPRIIGRKTQEIFNFVAVIGEDDLVLPSDGGRVLGIGRVTGDYFFEPTSDAPHRRPVEWLSLEEWSLPTPEGLRTTVIEIRKHIENQIEIERKILEAPSIDSEPPDGGPVGPAPLRPVRLDGVPGRIQAVLERKRQVILYGPPGTGKTYWAEKTARDLAAYAQFDQTFNELSPEQQPTIIGTDQANGLVRLCSFHPAYGYEDFLEGYRPQEINGQLIFERRDGIFKKLCQDAQQNPAVRFYLLIDEINRGDIPRIFGELLTVLEKDKRHKSILLPLSGQSFQVPDNVYLIGTMNTADRSIALLDTALRRRFGFIELMPDSSILGNTVVESIPLGPWLDALNAAICEHIGRDARNLQIGHAYLLDNGRPVSNFNKLARIIRDDILPLLEEYCYEDYATLTKILGKSLVDEPKQRIRHELFDPAGKDELIQALKAIDPNLDTSIQAVKAEAEDMKQVVEEDEDVDDSETAQNEV